MFKRSWVSLGLLALLGGFFTVATMPVSTAQASACFSTFTNKTVSNGLGSNTVTGVYVDGSTVYAATYGGLSISSNACSSSSSSSSSGVDAGVPGIFLTVAGPVGRSASEAPV